MEYDSLVCDVLVIGGGAAGLRAAIAASEEGSKVLLVSKRPPGRTGATPSAVLTYNASVGLEDNPELHEKDTMESGHYINNPELVRKFALDAPKSVSWLAERGMRWDKKDGQSDLVWVAGHTKPRGLHYDHLTGRELVRVLQKVAGQMKIEIRPYIWVMNLLVQGNRAAGAIAYDWNNGRILNIQAGAVILATGGAQQVYAFNTAPKDLTGDGFSLAYSCGVKLVDMEFVQMYPTVVVWPMHARGVLLTTGELFPAGATLLNAKGEQFFNHYTKTPLSHATRDEVASAISREVLAGRGTAHGGVFLELGQAPESLVQTHHFSFLRNLGVDLKASNVEVAPGAHFWLGGIDINTKAETNLEGLYAAGEVAGGVHGANRLAGNALPETMVFGEIAGKEAARYVQEAGLPIKVQLDGSCLEIMSKNNQTGRRPQELMTDLQQIMQESVGVIRTARGLRQAMRDISDLMLEMKHSVLIEYPPRKFDNNYCAGIEAYHALQTAHIVIKASLNRQESRGSYQRSDFPEESLRGPASQFLQRAPYGTEFYFSPKNYPVSGVKVILRSSTESISYIIPNGKGKTVMEVLQNIPDLSGSILHYSDHNCKRGTCGYCKMNINGKIQLACSRLISEDELTIELIDK